MLICAITVPGCVALSIRERAKELGRFRLTRAELCIIILYNDDSPPVYVAVSLSDVYHKAI